MSLSLGACQSQSQSDVAAAAHQALAAHLPLDPALNEPLDPGTSDRVASFVAALNWGNHQQMLENEKGNEGAFVVAAGAKNLMRYSQSPALLAELGHDVCAYSRANQDADALDALSKAGFNSRDAAVFIGTAESKLCATRP
ncbi:MAG: hypothetical protein JWO98_4793 [Frankiales bacterium]|nr:hypothetical protein [Frankiales bacterium]